MIPDLSGASFLPSLFGINVLEVSDEDLLSRLDVTQCIECLRAPVFAEAHMAVRSTGMIDLGYGRIHASFHILY